MAICDEAALWREPVPIVKAGQYKSVMQDSGRLRKAIKASNNLYLFSDKGIGTRALVLIGTPTNILEFFRSNASGIDNKIKELPDIYMGVDEYEPREQFHGLFPVASFAVQLTKQLLIDFLPFDTNSDVINTLFDASSNAHGFKEQITSLFAGEKNRIKNKMFYVKFSYLPEDGMMKIGEGKINFIDITRLIRDHIHTHITRLYDKSRT